MQMSDRLVWLDLEMSGLNPDHDVILEIAVIITNFQLQIIATGPDLVIHQPNTILENMDPWCVKQHAKSGLTQLVQQSTITLAQAQGHVLEFVKNYCAPQSALLAGNTIWQDRMFLRKYMPQLEQYFHYRMIDVSTIKSLINQWYPKNDFTKFAKADTHRALEDIQESIAELRHYRTHFFVPLL